MIAIVAKHATVMTIVANDADRNGNKDGKNRLKRQHFGLFILVFMQGYTSLETLFHWFKASVTVEWKRVHSENIHVRGGTIAAHSN